MTTDQVIVTGATGFLGRHLVATLLSQGFEVAFLQRSASASQGIAKDLQTLGARALYYSDSATLRAAIIACRPTILFHLATLYTRNHTGSQIDALVEANVLMGTNMLEAVVGTECVVISALSYFQYRNKLPTSYSLYSALKESFTAISNYYRDIAGVDVREVVLFDTYGPDDTRDKLLPHVVKAFRTRSSLALGPAAQPINLLHARDVAAGLIALAAGRPEPRSELRAPDDATVGEIVGLLSSISARSIDISFDNSRSVNALLRESGQWPSPPGWSSRTTLREGLEEYWISQLQDGSASESAG
jgi:nucleoside-diphosphate-sugar epimerase